MLSKDSRVNDARAVALSEVARRLGIDWLTRAGTREWVGACPCCGGHEKPGSDRFGLNDLKGVFQCRKCGIKGDGIALVMAKLKLPFAEALTWLAGPQAEKSEAEIERERREAEARDAARRATADRLRREAIEAARAVWRKAGPAEGTAVRDYLTLRGIAPEMLPAMPACLRFDPAARYVVPEPGERNRWRHLFDGPAMVAAIQGADGRFTAVHVTWLDLAQPKGKVVRGHPFKPGETVPAKKVLGSKKGGAIRLVTPPGADTLAMGEGIETTLTAAAGGVPPGAAFWAGVDLGNISGRRRSGKGLTFAGLPDLGDDEAFVPPDWVRRLVLIMDGDSEARATRAKVEAGARRAMALRPGLRAQIAPCPPGRDLNDVLTEREA